MSSAAWRRAQAGRSRISDSRHELTLLGDARNMADQQAERPVGMATSGRYLPELESLRGIAIAVVVAFHLNGKVRFDAQNPIDPSSVSLPGAFLWAGTTGVNLFFVLSGFLLSLPFFTTAASGGWLSLRRYFARRALRILPLYYVFVLATVALTATAWSDLGRIVPYMLFLNLVPGLSQSMGPYSTTWWSLATEAQFYLLLPLLPVTLRWRWGRVGGWAVLAGWALLYATWSMRIWRANSFAYQHFLGVSVFGRAPLFLCGIAAAWAYWRSEAARSWLCGRVWLRRGGADCAFVAVWILLGTLLQWVLRSGLIKAELAFNHPWHILEGLLWSTILLMLLLLPLRLHFLVHNRLWTRLGIWSYSLYLWHVPVILLGFRAARACGLIGPDRHVWQPRTVIVSAVLVGLAVLLSATTYHVIERPFLRRKERVKAASE